MVAAELGQELSRRMHVKSGLLRAAAVRVAYLAYSRALLRWDDQSSGEAAKSLAKHPTIFPPLYINMVAAGEASGTLEAVLTDPQYRHRGGDRGDLLSFAARA